MTQLLHRPAAGWHRGEEGRARHGHGGCGDVDGEVRERVARLERRPPSPAEGRVEPAPWRLVRSKGFERIRSARGDSGDERRGDDRTRRCADIGIGAPQVETSPLLHAGKKAGHPGFADKAADAENQHIRCPALRHGVPSGGGWLTRLLHTTAPASTRRAITTAILLPEIVRPPASRGCEKSARPTPARRAVPDGEISLRPRAAAPGPCCA